MPWKETTKVTEREEMVWKYLSGRFSISELADQYGVSRPTVYLWIERSEAGEGLADRAPLPQSCPHATDPAVVKELLKAKRKKPNWGPGKQRALLQEAHPEIEWPAVSTIGAIYEANGLVKKRRHRRRLTLPVRRLEQMEPSESGQLMSCDHKGWFRMGNGQYCYPLTIQDPVSRYIYCIDALSSTSAEEAKPGFLKVFRKYGVPSMMLSDNGGPFCSSRSLGGLTRLSVWWIKQGILPVRIRKGCPWENGIHERMHKTLKADTTRPPGNNLARQQIKFNHFRKEFNHERPHEGLGDLRPITQLRQCPREYSEQAATADVEYPGHYEVRRVRSQGDIKWRGKLRFLSDTLFGERVGLEQTDDGIWTIYFSGIELASYDERTEVIRG